MQEAVSKVGSLFFIEHIRTHKNYGLYIVMFIFVQRIPLSEKNSFGGEKILNMDIPKDQPNQLNIEISEEIRRSIC